MMWLAKKVKTEGWELTVYFNDGAVKKVDIRDYLKDARSPSAKKITTDMEYFSKVKIEDFVSLTWPSGFCIDPDVIHEDGIDVGRDKINSLIAALRRFVH